MLQRCSCNFPLAFGPFKCTDFGAFWRCLRNDDAEWWPQLQGDVLQERFSGRRDGMLLLFLNAMIQFAASKAFLVADIVQFQLQPSLQLPFGSWQR